MFDLDIWFKNKVSQRKPLTVVGKTDFEQLAKIILHPKYRKGEICVDSKELVGKIKRSLDKNSRLQFILPILPGKNQNDVQVRGYLPDLGEAAVLEHLSEIVWQLSRVLNNQARVYFTIIEDGIFFADVFSEDIKKIRAYSDHLKKLTNYLGLTEAIEFFDIRNLTDGNDLYWKAVAKERLILKKQVGENEAIRMIQYLNTKRNSSVVMSKIISEKFNKADLLRFTGSLRKQLTEEARSCLIEYRARILAWYKTGLFEKVFPDAIRVTDRPKPGMVGFHLIDELIETFPWYGVPVLGKDGKLEIWSQWKVDEKRLKYEGFFSESEPFVYLK